MADLALSRRLAMRLTFLGLAMLILFFHLLPLDTLPRAWAPPDLLVAIIFAWTLRRPDYVPLPSVAATMLLYDLLLGRPPGLMALLVVLGCEYLRTRAAALRRASFAGEWLAVCLTLAAIAIAERSILALLGVQQAQLSLTVIQTGLTMAVYPPMVIASQSLLGVRKPAPGDTEALGGRT